MKHLLQRCLSNHSLRKPLAKKAACPRLRQRRIRIEPLEERRLLSLVSLVEDINQEAANSNPMVLAEVGGTLYFSADDGTDRELWKYDGRTATKIEINSGSGDSDPDFLTDVGGTLYFSAYDGTDRELWKYDGSTATKIEINPGPGESDPDFLADVGGTLYFRAYGGTDIELWKHDGSTATKIDINSGPTSSSYPYDLTAVDGTLYFSAYDGTDEELWKCDGSTVTKIEINSGTGDSYPSYLTDVGGTPYFSAYDGTDRELWKYDGSTAIKIEINSGAGDSDPDFLTAVDGTLYFSAYDGTDTELWKYDGSTAAAKMDIYSGSMSSSPSRLTAVAGRLYFSANVPPYGRELWMLPEGEDFGDAPDSYGTLLTSNGARHTATGPTLGASRDAEDDARSPLDGSGDDTIGTSDDEDGVTISGPFLRGDTSASVDVLVTDHGALGAFLDAWIDFDGNGVWSTPAERIFSGSVSSGWNTVTFTVPSDARNGETYARFRLNSTAAGLSPSGAAADGEVEDYQVTVAEPLGPVTFVELNGLNPSAGDLWYRGQATRQGLLTLEALVAGEAGSVRLTLYNENRVELTTSTLIEENQRIDWPTAAGAVYYVKVYGTNGDLDLRIANLLRYDASTKIVTVQGTDGNDTFNFNARASRDVTINGIRYHFDDAQVKSVTFDGGDGFDKVILDDSIGNDTLTAWATHAVFSNSDQTPGFTVTVDGFEELHAYARNGGHDKAFLHDSDGRDKFKSEPAKKYAKMYGGRMYNRVKFFDLVEAFSSGQKDLARLFDTDGNDVFEGQQDVSWFRTSVFDVGVHNFRQVIGYALKGGHDEATLNDSALKDEVHLKGHKSEIFDQQSNGDVYKITARRFDTVHADGSGGARDDKVKMWDTTRDNHVEAADNWIRMSARKAELETIYEVLAFEFVKVRASTGGNDTVNITEPLNFDLLFGNGWNR